MAGAANFGSFDVLLQNTRDLSRDLEKLSSEIHNHRKMCAGTDVLQHILLIDELLNIEEAVKSLYNGLMQDLSLPPHTVSTNVHMMGEST